MEGLGFPNLLLFCCCLSVLLLLYPSVIFRVNSEVAYVYSYFFLAYIYVAAHPAGLHGCRPSLHWWTVCVGVISIYSFFLALHFVLRWFVVVVAGAYLCILCQRRERSLLLSIKRQGPSNKSTTCVTPGLIVCQGVGCSHESRTTVLLRGPSGSPRDKMKDRTLYRAS
jgi:hypothetical protein